MRSSEEDRAQGGGEFITGLMCSPSTQAKVLILGQLSFQRSTEAITPSRTFIREGRAGAPQASRVVRRRLGSAVEVEDSMLKRRSSLPLTHPRPGAGSPEHSALDPLFPLHADCPLNLLWSFSPPNIGSLFELARQRTMCWFF